MKRTLTPALTIPKPQGARDIGTQGADWLDAEAEDFRSIAGKLGENQPAATQAEGLAAFARAAEDWRNGRASPPLLAEVPERLQREVLRLAIGALPSLDALRKRLEDELAKLVPKEIVRSFDLEQPLKKYPDSGGLLTFQPGPDSKLTLTASARITLWPDPNIKATAGGRVGAFEIDVAKTITLKFNGARFGGEGSGFDVAFAGVELGGKLGFLKDLQSYLGSDKDGPYVRPTFGGIEAGYVLPPSTIPLPGLVLADVSLAARCHLPFRNADAQFSLSLGRRDLPCLIWVPGTIWGGSAFIEFTATGSKVTGFELGFEFGGVAPLSFGPFEGRGRITTGLHIRQGTDGFSLTGIFFAGGSGRIACFGISVSLTVTLEMIGSSARGRAVFEFTFSVGPFDVSYVVEIEKTYGSGFADAGHGRDTRYASASDDLILLASGSRPPPVATLRNKAKSAASDPAVHASYFDRQLDGTPP